jgi:hypothetical protein
MRSALCALAALAAVAATPLPLAARELHGVKSPDTLPIAGKVLQLNGMGLRKKLFFKVYVASLYLETPSRDASAILAADQVRRVEMVMLRDLSAAKIADAVREGFAKNSAAALPKLQDRLDRLLAIIPDLKEGEKLALTYQPGRGTGVGAAGGAERIVLEGKDFADALFSVWLGPDPVSEPLKAGMLGAE